MTEKLYRAYVERGPGGSSGQEVIAALDWRDANPVEARTVEARRASLRWEAQDRENLRAKWLALGVFLALLLALVWASAANADERIKTNGCRVYAYNLVDPIAFSSHVHAQLGNTSTSNSSTGASLKAWGRNSCSSASSWFTSAGWFPVPSTNRPDRVAVYYRDPGNFNNLEPIPTGLKLLTHNARFNSAGSVTLHFPNCLAVQNGQPVLDSFNHESHARDAGARACPSTHPYRIPRISYLIRGDNIGPATLISIGNNQYGAALDHMHGDYFAANQDVFNNRLIDLCLNTGDPNEQAHHIDCG